jgi:site-specific DNA recombinase
VYRDDGYSGASLRRPGLDRLRDAVASVGLDRILITAPDRLARNYVHQVLLVEELQKHGAEVVFLDRPMSRILMTNSCCRSVEPSPSMSAP